jgi:hypothetical protein
LANGKKAGHGDGGRQKRTKHRVFPPECDGCSYEGIP